MTSFPKKVVMRTLRGLGFQPASGSNRGGHDLWKDGQGRTCHPVAFKRCNDIPIHFLYSLGLELEIKGVVSRRELLERVKGVT